MSMRRFMIHDGERFEISPFSVWVDDLGKSNEEFERVQAKLQDQWDDTFRWCGGNDIAYRDFLRWNGLHDLDDFTEETLAEACFQIVDGEPDIDKEMVYGVIDWTEIRGRLKKV